MHKWLISCTNGACTHTTCKHTTRTRAVPECLTEGEELMIQQYYLASLMDKSTSTLQLPTSVEATALAYFQRFYLHNSVMDYHPKDVMLTVLWVACKVEHYPTRFLKAPKVKIGDNRKVCIHVFMCMCVCIYRCIYICVCIYVCMYISIYV